METLNRKWEYVKRHMARLLPKREEAPDNTSLIYQPLQHREIRIVSLSPGKWKDRLECTLEIVSLDHTPSYETWEMLAFRRSPYSSRSTVST